MNKDEWIREHGFDSYTHDAFEALFDDYTELEQENKKLRDFIIKVKETAYDTDHDEIDRDCALFELCEFSDPLVQNKE